MKTEKQIRNCLKSKELQLKDARGALRTHVTDREQDILLREITSILNEISVIEWILSNDE
jgi:hypothetical protein